MQKYLLRRAITFFITAWLAASLSFFALLVVPGNPARIILGFDANPAALEALERRLGLDLPPLVRYKRWLGDVLRLDFGSSLVYDVPGARLIAERLPVTVPLTALAVVVTVGAGVPLGLAAARRRGRWPDVVIGLATQAGIATPSFWLGMFLIYAFAVQRQWLPAGGFTPWSEDPWAAFRSFILPAAALGAARAASVARLTRSAALEQYGRDYVRTARAKGLSDGAVARRHVLRNALLPVTTVLALEISQLLAGAIVIETVFSLPGIGALALGAVHNRDWPLVQAVVLSVVGVTLLLSFVSDVLYAYIDPRVRYA